MSKFIKIKPMDTQFFRDGTPFKAGTSNWIQSMLIPNPSVFYGAIFSAYLMQNSKQGLAERILSNNLKKEEKRNYEETIARYFSIKNIYLYDERENEIYIKAPLDMHIDDDNYAYIDSLENGLLKPRAKDYESVENKLISMNAYYQYILKKEEIKLYDLSNFILQDYKVGIELNSKRVSEDKQLYKMDINEFKDTNITYLIEYETDNGEFELRDYGFLKLGGESKVAKYKVEDDFSNYKLRRLENKSDEKIDKFKMVFKQAVFSDFIERIKDLEELKIIKLITDRAKRVGGYDYKKKRPKVMRKVYQAGTVLYIKSKEKISIEKLTKKIEESLQELTYEYESFKGFNSFDLIEDKGEQR
nr:type III-B CRISPR module-associated Cmr3 family protein [Halonatronum saccharophilum]